MPEPTTPAGTGRTFDVNGAAAYLGVHPASVQRWAKSGVLKGFRDMLHPGGPWRFLQGNLDEFKASRQQGQIS